MSKFSVVIKVEAMVKAESQEAAHKIFSGVKKLFQEDLVELEERGEIIKTGEVTVFATING